jgi:hypothetical protein
MAIGRISSAVADPHPPDLDYTDQPQPAPAPNLYCRPPSPSGHNGRLSKLSQPLAGDIPIEVPLSTGDTEVEGPPPTVWPDTSTVVCVADDACPSLVKGGSRADNECVACWEDEGNVADLKH